MGEDKPVECPKSLEDGKQSKWCADTKAILHNIGMGEAWTKQQWTTEEQTSLEGNQSEGRTPVERTYDAENKAENIPNFQKRR